MAQKNENLVPVSEMDYLEEDAPIRGQEYVCLSFLSPEKVLDNKDVFIFNKFTENFCKEVNELFQNLKIKYPDEEDTIQSIAERYRFLFNDKHMQEEYKYFLDDKADELNKQFSETIDFQTNVRGIKVRGSYASIREAQVRSEVLKRKDKNHNIYIAQVGCWCPWDPNPDNIDDQHYSEDKLNTLMKKYRENQQHKDEVFEDRKNDMLKSQQLRHEKITEQNKLLEDVEKTATDLENTVINTTETVKDIEELVEDVNQTNITKTVEDVNKTVHDGENLVKNAKETIEDVQVDINDIKNENVITNSGVGADNTVVENYNEKSASTEKVFESGDAWLDRKQE